MQGVEVDDLSYYDSAPKVAPPVPYGPKPARRRRGGGVPPTVLRTKTDPLGHRPPVSMLNNGGTMWRGTSRILDVPERRARMARQWARMKADARRAYVASKAAS
jgi:hypothetical protein